MAADSLVASAERNADEIPRGERWAGCLLLLSALILRLLNILRYRYDSDEPQHLHTTWGWTQGLLQYRDFFDNHTPLFHILFSPLVSALGERTNILTYMRLAIVPLWFVSLWCVWKMGSRLYSRRAGMWSTVIVSLLPWWFFCSVEYRTDNLWTPFWLGALTVLVTGKLTKGRAFLGGVLLGLAFCSSMKTVALVFAAMLATIAAPLLCARAFEWARMRRVVTTSACVIAGAFIAPAVLCAFFASQGAWDSFFYGVIKHNILAGVDDRNHPLYLRFALPIGFPFLCYFAYRIGKAAPSYSIGVRRAFIFLTGSTFFAALYSVWTLLTRQDFLPFYPVIAVSITPCILCGVDALARGAQKPEKEAAIRLASLCAIAVLEVGLIVGGRPLKIDGTTREREILSEFLSLTQPGEYVMDFKGEAVFRQRAFFFVLEPLTYVRLKRDLIVDNLAEELVSKHVYVALNQDRWYPRKGVLFLTQNYLPVGRTRVAGKIIALQSTPAGAKVEFDVAVPGAYVLWADKQEVTGDLDGKPYQGSVELSIGHHVFQPSEPHSRLAIFWARAAEKGFAPLWDAMAWQDFR